MSAAIASPSQHVAADFVSVSPRNPHYLQTGAGKAFIPNGLNISFPRFFTDTEDGLATMRRWLDALAAHGGNYARVFLGHQFFDIEHAGFGTFDTERAARIHAVIEHAWLRGIRLKLVLEVFRTIKDADQAEMFPGALRFSKAIYHKGRGGLFEDMEDFLTSQAGRAHFLQKLDWFAERYSHHPGILGWDLWNEMDSVCTPAYKAWTLDMLPELKRRFPHHVAMQNLGSFCSDNNLAHYEAIMPMQGNEIAQVHRYLDLGAQWPICHGPVDVMMADAITALRRLAPGKPALLSEGGAVEPHHARPWDHYGEDREGMILHDVIFAPFFAGAAGSGNPWHWHEYVHRNDIWWHFERFAKAINGIDPIQQGLEPSRSDSERLRVYVLRGRNMCLAWCRDGQNSWDSELLDKINPELLSTEKVHIPLPLPSPNLTSVTFYDPWTDKISQGTASDGCVALPEFRRSIVVRISHA